MPKTTEAMRFSIPSKIGSPSPAGRPSTAHSMTPPTESSSALASAIRAFIASPRASDTVGKSFSAVEASSSPSSSMFPIEAMREMTSIPSRLRICKQIPPAMHSGAVSLPEKCPPPA